MTRLRKPLVVFAAFLFGALLTSAVLAAPREGLLDRFADLAKPLDAIAPTPTGTGHIGQIESGKYVQLRFPVPKPLPLAYALKLGNVVGFSGRGTSYKLVLRRDSADGPIIYEGPVITNGDMWNASNRHPIDITAHLKPEDADRGYIDIFVTGIIEGDGWTVYRHNDGRPIQALVIQAGGELERMIRQEEQTAARGVAIVPAPQRITLADGSLNLSASSRIVLTGPQTDEARFAAADLAEQIAERCGLKLTVATGGAKSGDIVLARGPEVHGPEGYRLRVTATGARLTSSTDTGLFYAAQTLAQLLRPDGSVPCLEIIDWPDYPLRGLQYDVARGQTVNVDWWKRVIRSLARYKLNAIMIYGENDYRFEAYPFLGREGTFTPQKARELSEYAHRYHLQLIPQFESLGHASAVLRHEQLADLREAGSPWVFCTSNPKTWQFLETVIDELCRQFPYAQYIHIGADEFEWQFGKCPKCRAKVEKVGYAGLYAEHLNRLNEIIRKRGRTMLFWPSHGGPRPELSYLTIKAAKAGLLNLDCIPTEWIYHGPARYPQIKQYQDLGFKDVWASPAVVCFSIIWPDYRTTYRGIRGFLRAGAERGIKGAMTTTWEWMQGGVVANSLLGMAYAAECAWSLGRTTVADYERRYAGSWLGLPANEKAGAAVHDLLAMPWPRSGPLAFMNNARFMRRVFWDEPRQLQWLVAQHNELRGETGEKMVAYIDKLLKRLGRLRAQAKRNADLLRYTELAYRMYRFAGQKLSAMDAAGELYAEAAADPRPPKSADALALAAEILASPLRELDICIGLYQAAVEQMGSYAGDVDRMKRQRQAIAAIVEDLRKLSSAARDGKLKALPPASDFGLLHGQALLVGRWSPKEARTDGFTMRIDVTGKIKRAGTILVLWRYTRGAHGVWIKRTALLADGKEVAVDDHRGWTGASHRDNTYTLNLDQFSPQAKYEIVGDLQSSGGTDSSGEVWIIVPQ